MYFVHVVENTILYLTVNCYALLTILANWVLLDNSKVRLKQAFLARIKSHLTLKFQKKSLSAQAIHVLHECAFRSCLGWHGDFDVTMMMVISVVNQRSCFDWHLWDP